MGFALQSSLGKKAERFGLSANDYEHWRDLVNGLRSIPSTFTYVWSHEDHEMPSVMLYYAEGGYKLTRVLCISIPEPRSSAPYLSIQRLDGSMYKSRIEEAAQVTAQERERAFGTIKSLLG